MFKLKVCRVQRHLAGFDFRKIQNVVDHREQVHGGTRYLVQLTFLVVNGCVSAQQMGEPDDGVHRGADFVAHVGEERALGAVGVLGCIFCHLQLAGGLTQLCRALFDKLFQLITVAQQLALTLLAIGNV